MLPDQSAWLQYPIVAVIMLAAVIIAYGFYRLFVDLLKFIKEQNAAQTAWIAAQDLAREKEREKQRVWQEDQSVKSDERWQAFLKSMQEEWLGQVGRNNDTVNELIVRLDDLIKEFRTHDQHTRESIVAMRERTRPIQKATE